MSTWVMIAGLPGVGKSTLAHAVATKLRRQHRVAILDKDRIRAAIFPGDLTDYSEEQDNLCMQAMIAAAEYLTARGKVEFIIFDGRPFSRQKQIEEVIEAAERQGADWRIAHLKCPESAIRTRLAQPDPQHPAHNRTLDLYRRMEREFEPITRPNLEIDTGGGVEAEVAVLEQYLLNREAASAQQG